MPRILLTVSTALCLALAPAVSIAQNPADNQVSGPAQMQHSRSTGKSYKKGTRKQTPKLDDSKTGQTKRLGNTGDLTNKGDDASGKRAETPGNAKKNSK